MSAERHDRARALIDSGAFAEALLALTDSRESAPQTHEDKVVAAILRLRALNGLSRWGECVAVGAEALALLPSPEEKSLIHGLLGFAQLRLGSVRRAESHLRAAIHILTWDIGDLPGALRQQRRLALVFHGSGLWGQARYEFEKAIEIADEAEVHRESAGLRINLASTSMKSGHLREIPELLEIAAEHIEISSESTPYRRLIHTLTRANYLRITGQPNKALELLEPVLVVCREQQYSREEAIALEYTGDCRLAKKDYKSALEANTAAMKIAEATAPRGDMVPELCHRIAECLVHIGDPNEAILFCERGLRVARDIGDRYEECATHRVLAMAQKAAGNPRKALRLADEGAELGRSYEIPYELARALTWAGEARLAENGIDEQALGRKQLWEARGHFARMELRHWIETIDRTLGYEPGSEAEQEEDAGLATLNQIEALDRGALRFGLVTCSRAISEAVATVQSIAPTPIPVLICGESGVGKELLARAVHQMSDRRKGPFVAVNCGAISTGLLESEMFGHERGAFTGAVQSREGLLVSADNGTLFLDEIGDLPTSAQASLLRVLESGEMRPLGKDEVRRVDVRLVAATNVDLEEAVRRGTFRQDLYFRLSGVRVTLSPLREREEDIRLLFRYYWAQACAASKKSLRLSEAVEAVLCAYDWPGNVRELRHEVARVVALAPANSNVTPEQFLPGTKRREAAALRLDRAHREAVTEARDTIVKALRAHRGNKAEAARSLGGMKRTTLLYKMQSLEIRPEEYETRE